MPRQQLNNPTFTNTELAWRLKELMALRGIRTVVELHQRLDDFGYRVGISTLYRLYHDRPSLMDLSLFEALLTVLECQVEDLLKLKIQNPSPKISLQIRKSRLAKLVDSAPPFRTIHQIEKDRRG